MNLVFPRLYAIIDSTLLTTSELELAETLAVSGVELIQYRNKTASSRQFFEISRQLTSALAPRRVRLIVNDRADIALAGGADGVHLAANSLSVDVIRRSFPHGFIIGVSTHTLEQVAKSSADEADFAVFGPVFETPGKDMQQGLEKLSEVCERLRHFPILALGGVDKSNVASVLEAGAVGMAAIRSLNDSTSLRTICRKLRK